MSCLRKILNIKWQDKIPDTEVLTKANLQPIFTILKKAQARWTGNVCRMPDNRLPKQLLYGELVRGKRSVGGQKKRFKDGLKVAISNLGIPVHSWGILAADRPAWRAALNQGLKDPEAARLEACRKKREARKTRSESFNSTSQNSTTR